MSDIYRIAVRLTMESNAPAFLASLAQQLLHVHANVRDLEGGLLRLNRVKLAIGGGLAIAGGVAMLDVLKKMTDQAKELSHELASVGNMRMGALAGASLMGRADETARRTTTQVPGSTESGNVRLFGESYSMFGEDGAAAINARLARFGQAIGGSTGDYHGAEEGLYAMLRSGDLMGKLVNEQTHKVDPDKLTGYLDTASKMIAATHGKVNTGTFLAMAQQGGPALSTMSEEGLMSMAMVAQGMGGFRAGTAMSSLKQQMVGGTMGKAQAQALESMGLINGFSFKDKKVRLSDHDRDTPFVKAMGTDMLAAAKILQDTLKAHGKDDIQKQTDENYQLFGRQTTQRIISDLLRNLPQMMAERTRIEGAEGVNGQTTNRNDNDYGTVEHNMQSAYTNMMQAIAGPNSVAAIDVMKQITSGLNYMTDGIRKMDPATLISLGKGFAVAGAALTGAGAVALIAALGPAGWIALGVAGLAGAFAAFKPAQFKQYVEGLKEAFDGLMHLDFGKVVAGIGKELSAAIDTLPADVAGSIHAAIAGIAGIFNSAIAGIGSHLASVKGWIDNHLGSKSDGTDNIGALPQAFHGNTPARSGVQNISDRVRSNSVPKAGQITAQNTVNVHLDGKQIAKVVTKNQVAAMEYPHAIGGHDSYGSYYPAGGTAMPS